MSVMQAITVKYLAPTETKGARLKASVHANSYHGIGTITITMPCDHACNGSMAYAIAAWALVEKLGWSAKELVGGSIKGGYVFCITPGCGGAYGRSSGSPKACRGSALLAFECGHKPSARKRISIRIRCSSFTCRSTFARVPTAWSSGSAPSAGAGAAACSGPKIAVRTAVYSPCSSGVTPGSASSCAALRTSRLNCSSEASLMSSRSPM